MAPLSTKARQAEDGRTVAALKREIQVLRLEVAVLRKRLAGPMSTPEKILAQAGYSPEGSKIRHQPMLKMSEEGCKKLAPLASRLRETLQHLLTGERER